MKIFKKSYIRESVNNQKVQKFVPVLDENLSMKNAPKLSAKYLCNKIFKIEIIQNISVNLRTFLTFIWIKWYPWDPSTTFLATIFAQKNARKLRFYVFLHFNVRKHMMLSFYPMWTEFTRNWEFIPI